MKLKFDVTESDPESAVAAGSFEKPLPGLYRFSIKEVNGGHTKGDDGKPDKAKPRVEVVLACEDSRYRNAQVWAYFVQKGHPSYDKGAAEKWDQLLLALGISSDKKRSGEIDTDKQMVGKFVTVRVRGGKDQAGDYRAEYGSVFPDGHAGVATDTPGDEELIDESSGEDEVIEDDSESEDWDARHAELTGADVPTLKEIAKTYGIKITGMKKSELVDALIEYEKALDSGDDEEIIEDDDEVIEDDAPTTIYLTRDGLAAMEVSDLVAAAKDFDIVTKGKKKSEVIEEILTAQAAPDDDTMPF